ncbi:Hypothetical protein SRAE_1000332800 [Strongyloides ratti]|uniref:Uncharacterized protein n=1 Tax=Strongyloides ratti TaxID=34506 RepID=A0A090LC12_STRRB|nr:Hypothetical protein SRAE_1000332800 [Strongyloides ratti]CEF65075.1 Hypothetical protein SRAE_1000332800 [Strongyloides ratti]
MIAPSIDSDIEIVTTPSPKSPPDHHLSGHVNLSFEPYIFQASNDVPFYYIPYSNSWNQHYREEDNFIMKMKYPMVFCFILIIIIIITVTYIVLDTTFVSTTETFKE